MKPEKKRNGQAKSTRSRREFLALGGAGTLGAAFALPAVLGQSRSDSSSSASSSSNPAYPAETGHPRGTSGPLPVPSDTHAGGLGTVGDISPGELSVFDPSQFLTSWNFSHLPERLRSEFYRESTLSSGQLLREYKMVAWDRDIEIAAGLFFPAWTYNQQVPGPTMRASAGDRIRIWFVNQGSHPHTIHFHGWHRFEVDGTMPDQFVYPAGDVSEKGLEAPFGPGADPTPWLRQDPVQLRRRGLEIYEFDADPVGLHLYHCHSLPLKRHIHKGLYGVFIVDPPGQGDFADRRPKIDPDTNQPLAADHPVRELVMMMNAFDTSFDADNEVYAVNTVAFHYMRHPIVVKVGELIRVYLVNMTEFDPINSFHLHAGFFRVYRTGSVQPSQEYTDTLMMCQAERAVLEFRFREDWPGEYMFHAHQSEFAELGWMGKFAVQPRSEQLASSREITQAPEFALVDQQGRIVRLADFRGRKNVVLVFHRGVSCSFCGDQMRLLRQKAPAIRELDAEVVAVSGDPPAVNRAKSADSAEAAFVLLSDPDHAAAGRYGTYAAESGRQQHGTFLLDKQGRIRWKYVGEQPWMDMSALLQELGRLNRG